MNNNEAIKWLEQLRYMGYHVDQVPDEHEILINKALFHAIEVLKTSQWRDIISAPTDGTRILARHLFSGEMFVVHWCNEIDEWTICKGEIVRNLTHWMLLPPAPKEGE